MFARLFAIGLVAAAFAACKPCDRVTIFTACFGANDSECATVNECPDGEQCLPCGICAEDECDNLAGSCASNADCDDGTTCNERCGCVR